MLLFDYLDDIEFYNKQLWVYEDVQRAKIAQAYMDAANSFLCEALYTFVDCLVDNQGDDDSHSLEVKLG